MDGGEQQAGSAAAAALMFRGRLAQLAAQQLYNNNR
jgi:hypothetical protein